MNIFDIGLDKNDANFRPITPLTLLVRAAEVFPEKTACVYHDVRRSWGETYTRCRQLSSALKRKGFGVGDTVSIISANIPEMFEAHFGVPMSGAVLNTINTRLDAEAIAFILTHAEAKMVIVDPEFSEVVDKALHMADVNPEVIDIIDPSYEGGRRLGKTTYDELLESGDAADSWDLPEDEWQAISLNYTSGTTGDPKGVVCHHRGAYLAAIGEIMAWQMVNHPVYLWTLPMFHCNGWCYPWAMAAVGGTSVCLRAVRAEPIFRLIREEKVDYFSGAPIVLNMLANADKDIIGDIRHHVKILTAGAPPPASVIEKVESLGFTVTHVYGLTETYGPSVVCEWKKEWDELPVEKRAGMKARQGVPFTTLEAIMVADPDTLEPVPKDGETMGEIFMRGNIVMRGYLKNPSATEKAFKGGWFHSGDLAVWHPDNYVEIKDRSKDIIISGGENISSVEVEDIMYRHPAIMEVAVVARPDEKWGETPCAFVTVKPGETVTEEEIISFCRDQMAHFKAPKTIIFQELPKTSTGKIQKFQLRNKAKGL